MLQISTRLMLSENHIMRNPVRHEVGQEAERQGGVATDSAPPSPRDPLWGGSSLRGQRTMAIAPRRFSPMDSSARVSSLTGPVEASSTLKPIWLMRPAGLLPTEVQTACFAGCRCAVGCRTDRGAADQQARQRDAMHLLHGDLAAAESMWRATPWAGHAAAHAPARTPPRATRSRTGRRCHRD